MPKARKSNKEIVEPVKDSVIEILELTPREVKVLDVAVPEQQFEGICSVEFCNKVNNLPSELRDLNYSDYKELFRAKRIYLNETIECLRDSFWLEFDRAKNQNRAVRYENIYDGICSYHQWYEIISVPLKLSYIICRPIKYDARLSAVLRANSAEVLNSIMNAPEYNLRGDYDVGVARLKLAALKQIEDRVQGSVVQKSEIKQLNVNVGDNTPRTVEEIQKRIAEITEELNRGNSNA